jgi:hypothetical protein
MNPSAESSKPLTREILVLANSIKRKQRCVAGMEVFRAPDGSLCIGHWIRPVDPRQPEGAIPFLTARVGGRPVVPLDLVEIAFEGPANDPFHPEDWTIAAGQPWRRSGSLESEILNQLPDESGDLWGAGSAHTRRVLPTGKVATLRLLKGAERIRAVGWKIERADKESIRSMLYFTKAGIEHQFTIEDPEFGLRHRVAPSVRAAGTWTLELNPAKTVVVASLTPPFKGFHYKVAATIIEQ